MLRSLAAFGLALAFLSSTPATAAEVTIRFPVEYSLEIAPGIANQEFKKLVEERTNGRVEVKIFPAEALQGPRSRAGAAARRCGNVDADGGLLGRALTEACGVRTALCLPDAAGVLPCRRRSGLRRQRLQRSRAEGRQGHRDPALRSFRHRDADEAAAQSERHGRPENARAWQDQFIDAGRARRDPGLAQSRGNFTRPAAGRDRRTECADRHHARLQVVRVR